MLLTELYTEIANDFPINNTDLGNEATKSTTLWIKYIKLWSDENLRMEKLQSGRSTLIALKREYYSGNASPEIYKANPFNGKSPKTEGGLQKLIENDTDVIAYDESLIVQKQKVEVLVSCLDECKRRGYAIRAAIDYTKFINGG